MSANLNLKDIAAISVKYYANYNILIESVQNTLIQITDIKHTLIPGILLGIYEQLSKHKDGNNNVGDLLTELNRVIISEFPQLKEEIYKANLERFESFVEQNPVEIITLLPNQFMSNTWHDRILNSANLISNRKLAINNNSTVKKSGNDFLASVRTLQAESNVTFLAIGKSLGHLIANNLLFIGAASIPIDLIKMSIKTVMLCSYTINTASKVFYNSLDIPNILVGACFAFTIGAINAYIDNEHYQELLNASNISISKETPKPYLSLQEKFSKNYQKQLSKIEKYKQDHVIEKMVWQKPFKNISSGIELSITSIEEEDNIVNHSIDFFRKICINTKAGIDGLNATILEQAFEEGSKLTTRYLQFNNSCKEQSAGTAVNKSWLEKVKNDSETQNKARKR